MDWNGTFGDLSRISLQRHVKYQDVAKMRKDWNPVRFVMFHLWSPSFSLQATTRPSVSVSPPHQWWQRTTRDSLLLLQDRFLGCLPRTLRFNRPPPQTIGYPYPLFVQLSNYISNCHFGTLEVLIDPGPPRNILRQATFLVCWSG